MFRGNAYYRNLSILLLTVLVPLILVLIFLKNPSEPLIFPKAFAMVIDDLGWMNGSSLEKENGPYRLNFNRKMRLLDYKPVVEVAKSLGIRFQGIFILCELDRENVCARFPTTTWMGSGWDISANIDSSQLQIMQYIKDNAAFLEFGMHGIGHEYWDKGRKTRAEYYNTEDRQPWPEDTLRGHFECFRNIMDQYGWTGQSFPESFVPTAHSYYWNPAGKYSLGSILRDYGVKYVNFKLSLAAYQ
ncbi:MAG: hypothetical protein KKA81_14825 [Bacteroidetes bacterium]|nr:hypothetical protein [Bacteroidota bacterium]